MKTVNEKIEELEQTERRRENSDLRKVLSTPEGRRFIWKMLGRAGVFRSSFTGNSHTFFNEGKREIGLGLFEDVMTINSEMFVRMQKENTSLENNKDIEISKIKKGEQNNG